MSSGRGPHGVLVLDKPEGPTSHDVVGKVRRIFGTRRVGHAGTLDPMATGVLVILLGEATKLSAVLTRETKEYEAEIEFGKATDSLDAQGKTTRYRELTAGWLDHARLGQALEVELFRELQVPPAVSAIKVDGQRSYALARVGQAPELEPRHVHVHGLELLAWDERRASVRLVVSKGYYVRSFARDLGDTLGVPSHLSRLRRVASGAFRLEGATPFPPSANAPLLSLGEAVRRSLGSLEVTQEGALRLRQGKLLRPEDLTGEPAPPRGPGPADPEWLAGPLAAFGENELLGLVEPDALLNHFKVKRGFVPTGEIEPGGDGLHPSEGGG